MGCLLLGAREASAAHCTEGQQPCGDQCIAIDAACRVKERPGSEDTGWQIPWELLNRELGRGILFAGIYGVLVLVARERSVGPREV